MEGGKENAKGRAELMRRDKETDEEGSAARQHKVSRKERAKDNDSLRARCRHAQSS